MAVSVSTDLRGTRAKRPLDAELNLIPFIDLLVCCICFLLITAVWIQLSRIDVSMRRPGAGREAPQAAQTRVSVLVGDEGYTLAVGGERLAIPKQGAGYDTEGLERLLLKLRARLPSVEELTVAAEDGVRYRHLVHAMDAAHRAHFGQIQVTDSTAKL